MYTNPFLIYSCTLTNDIAGADPKYTGLGILRKGPDGEVVMDELNSFIVRGKAIRVRIKRKDQTTGLFTLANVEYVSTITGTIEKARDLVYENELFLEIVREARTLANLGIWTSEDCVSIDFGNDNHALVEMVFDSLPLGKTCNLMYADIFRHLLAMT